MNRRLLPTVATDHPPALVAALLPVLLPAVLLSIVLPAPGQAQEPADLVIVGARVLDVDTGRVVPGRTGTAFDDVAGLTDDQRARARRGYENLAGYVQRLHEAGIPMADVFRIATRNGARAFGLDGRGAVAPGMQADLVLWAGIRWRTPRRCSGRRP